MRIALRGVATNRFHEEMIAAGIVPALVESRGDDTWVTVEDGQEAAVAAVVAAHDAAGTMAAADAEQAAVADDYSAARQAVAQLQAYVDLASPTAAQTTAAVRLLCRMAIVIIRRVMRLA